MRSSASPKSIRRNSEAASSKKYYRLIKYSKIKNIIFLVNSVSAFFLKNYNPGWPETKEFGISVMEKNTIWWKIKMKDWPETKVLIICIIENWTGSNTIKEKKGFSRLIRYSAVFGKILIQIDLKLRNSE